MANYESCCYVEYSNNSQTYKYCKTLTENITDSSNYSNETIKNSFEENNLISKVVCPGIYVTHKYINNCGLVGILPPISKENCSGISIPESNCPARVHHLLAQQVEYLMTCVSLTGLGNHHTGLGRVLKSQHVAYKPVQVFGRY